MNMTKRLFTVDTTYENSTQENNRENHRYAKPAETAASCIPIPEQAVLAGVSLAQPICTCVECSICEEGWEAEDALGKRC
jgi:hypothetical protein